MLIISGGNYGINRWVCFHHKYTSGDVPRHIKKRSLRHGHIPAKGGKEVGAYRHGHNLKKGVFGMGITRKRGF